MVKKEISLALAFLIAYHYDLARSLREEAIAATADMDTERGEELQARSDAAQRAAVRLLNREVNPDDACPAG